MCQKKKRKKDLVLKCPIAFLFNLESDFHQLQTVGLAVKTTCVFQLEPTPEPWDDLIKGPISHNVAEIEGDPVRMLCFVFGCFAWA